MRLKLILIIIGIFCFISFISAMPIHVKPKVYGQLYRETLFTYQFNFTTNADCSGIVMSFLADIFTGVDGVGFVDLNISGISPQPTYLCEYKNGNLRKIHNIPDIVFSDIYARNLNLSENLEATTGFFTTVNAVNISLTGNLDVENITAYNITATNDVSVGRNLTIIGDLVVSGISYLQNITFNMSVDFGGGNITGNFSIDTAGNITSDWGNFNNINVTGLSYLGDLIIEAENITTDNIIPLNNGNVSVMGNLTIWDTITFRLGEMIDNLIDGWIRITGNLNVTGDLNVEGGVNATTFNGTYYGDGSNLIISTTYNATDINVTAGTYDKGTLNSIISPEDEDTYNVSESAGANPLIITINFTNVVDFNTVIGRIYYEGGQGHEMQLEIQRSDTGAWENYEEYTDMTDFVNIHVPLFDPENHIWANGDVAVRFNHFQNGIPSHNFFIDYITIVDGFTTVTIADHDGLGGRDDKENHPWAFDIKATRNITGKLIVKNDTLIEGNLNVTRKTETNSLDVYNITRIGNIGTNYSVFGAQGDLLMVGGADYLVGCGRYIFRASISEKFGMFLNCSPSGYEFKNSSGGTVVTIRGSGVILNEGGLDAKGNGTFRGNNICNTTACFSLQDLNATGGVGGGDNESWNESYADTLYSAIGTGGNTSWNESYARDIFIENFSNLTIMDKITFRLGEIIDNLVEGWIRITGNLNVTGNLTVSGNYINNGTATFSLQDLNTTGGAGGGVMDYTNLALINQTNVFSQNNTFKNYTRFGNLWICNYTVTANVTKSIEEGDC